MTDEQLRACEKQEEVAVNLESLLNSLENIQYFRDSRFNANFEEVRYLGLDCESFLSSAYMEQKKILKAKMDKLERDFDKFNKLYDQMVDVFLKIYNDKEEEEDGI